ncbi:ATP-binding protein [Bengtsoniella intestinalis]|uniref:sensor histidine kinase n=1 Tax=Bengtsoniella intestinalis TaxID=3073143 RepID=UPI00391F65E7
MKRIHHYFRGIYWQQLYITVGLVLLSMGLLGASFSSLSHTFIYNLRIEELQDKAQMVAQLSSTYLTDDMSDVQEDLRQLASFAATVSDVDFFVCNIDGTVLLTTDSSQAGQVIQIPQEITSDIITQGQFKSQTTVGGLYKNSRMVVGVPVYNISSGQLVGEVFAVSTTDSFDQLWTGFVGLFLMTALVVLLIAAMVSSATTMRQIRPLRNMVAATRRYAQGDFDVRIKDYEHIDEMGELATAFNAMADTLQENEFQRREFVANISHELKTPMTTIAGYTDGILDGTIPPERQHEYLTVISEESRRLSRLVRRMLDVSQLQAIDPLRNGEHFDICESMRRVIISLERKITDRGLDMDVEIPDESLLVLGDNDMITQVIYNLLENTTKFAKVGTAVHFGLTHHDTRVTVTVRNLGDTIPAQEIPRLFDRFHKSDKSRSEDKDGVGLGLYIVKTILEQHKEPINVSSENGVTTFSFGLNTE